jgi:hypothetical protein
MTFSEKISSISLPDPDGRIQKLGDLWAQSPAVVVFLRHYG